MTSSSLVVRHLIHSLPSDVSCLPYTHACVEACVCKVHSARTQVWVQMQPQNALTGSLFWGALKKSSGFLWMSKAGSVYVAHSHTRIRQTPPHLGEEVFTLQLSANKTEILKINPAFPNTAKNQNMLFFLNCIPERHYLGTSERNIFDSFHPPSDHMFGKLSSSALNKCISHFMMMQFDCCQWICSYVCVCVCVCLKTCTYVYFLYIFLPI